MNHILYSGKGSAYVDHLSLVPGGTCVTDGAGNLKTWTPSNTLLYSLRLFFEEGNSAPFVQALSILGFHVRQYEGNCKSKPSWRRN